MLTVKLLGINVYGDEVEPIAAFASQDTVDEYLDTLEIRKQKFDLPSYSRRSQETGEWTRIEMPEYYSVYWGDQLVAARLTVDEADQMVEDLKLNGLKSEDSPYSVVDLDVIETKSDFGQIETADYRTSLYERNYE